MTKEFKRIEFPDEHAMVSDDELDFVSGGKQNRDENGDWDRNPDHMKKWYNDVYNTYFYWKCPNCGERMFYNFEKYNGDAWWYCFWYNRLWCCHCSTWTEELS